MNTSSLLKTKGFRVASALVLLTVSPTLADDINWNSGGGSDTAFENTANWDSGALPGVDDNYYIGNGGNATFSAASGEIFVKRGFIGETANVPLTTLSINGGKLEHSYSHNSYATRIGRRSDGIVNISGGSFNIGHRLQIGETAAGVINLDGGALVIYRAGTILTDETSASLDLYKGSLNISGGTFLTRTSVVVGSEGDFRVSGSGAQTIGIGSNGDIDGNWIQKPGGRLSVGIDLGGSTTIFVDDYEEDGGSSATFESGAVLDVDYINGGYGGGTWTVLELENGDIIDNGLIFAPTVDTGIWSFSIDNSGVNGKLLVTALGTPGPIGGSFFTVEAEDYDSANGVRLESCSDEGGGQNVAYISNRDWCRYNNIYLGTDAVLNFRVARPDTTDDGHIEVRLDSTNGLLIAQLDVPKTGEWQIYETISSPIPAIDGAHDIYLVFIETSTSTGGSLFNMNWWSREIGPTRIEAEKWSAQNGIRTENTADIGGGLNIGWIGNGDWSEYVIDVKETGLQKIDFRVASDNSDGTINISTDGTHIGSIAINDTGSWQTWTTVSTYVNFTKAGLQTLRLSYAVPSRGFNINWFSYERFDVPLTLTVGDTRNQMMRYGLDYERLWFWYGSYLDEVPQWSVNDCNIDYIRCAINCEYELDEGTYDLSAYTQKIIPMMTAMRNANPDIKWFASPRPLNEAVSGAAWQPYPIWITGASSYTSTSFDFNATKCAEYLIRYLLLMKSYGFKITFMDLTNEWQGSSSSSGRFKASDAAAIKQAFADYLSNPWPHPALDSGLILDENDFPLIVVPSSYSYFEGASWLHSVDNGAEKDAIDITACHNTSKVGSADAFAEKARYEFGDDVEVWNSEVHGWKSTDGANEVTTFWYMLEAIRAGFTGLNGWLAIGTSNQGHSYLLNTGSRVVRNVKYYIFKKLSNTSNYGHALDINLPAEFESTAALIRENILTIWIVNTSTEKRHTEIDIGSRVIGNPEVRFTRWNESLDVEGVEGMTYAVTANSFIASVEGESVYCFEVTLPVSENNFPFVQAESYADSNGTPVLSCSDTNGGEMVEFTDAGDEISFNLDVTRTCTYDIAFRCSSESAAITFDLYDGNTFLTSLNRIATGDAQGWTTIYKTLPLDGGRLNLRIVATGGGWNLNWIEFIQKQSIDASGLIPENLALGQTATASNIYNENYPASLAVDGQVGTRWATSEQPVWLEVDFGTPTTINGVSFIEYGNRTTAYAIQYSDEGTNWNTAFIGGNPEDNVIYYFAPVTATKFRYQSITSNNSPTIYEFQLYYDRSVPTLMLDLMDNSALISWSGLAGCTYSLQRSTNLVTDAFTTIESGIPIHSATNFNLVTKPEKAAFYRVIRED